MCEQCRETEFPKTFSVLVMLNTALSVTYVRESVDSVCRDGTDTPIVHVHTKSF